MNPAITIRDAALLQKESRSRTNNTTALIGPRGLSTLPQISTLGMNQSTCLPFKQRKTDWRHRGRVEGRWAGEDLEKCGINVQTDVRACWINVTLYDPRPRFNINICAINLRPGTEPMRGIESGGRKRRSWSGTDGGNHEGGGGGAAEVL